MSSERLYGTDLIDCARANGKKGIEVAAERCGYSNDLETFEHELRKACNHIGVELQSFDDLVKTPQDRREQGIEIAPESTTQF